MLVVSSLGHDASFAVGAWWWLGAIAGVFGGVALSQDTRKRVPLQLHSKPESNGFKTALAVGALLPLQNNFH